MRIIGDIHGDYLRYQRIVSEYQGPTIQVGDFGLGFPRRQARDETIMRWMQDNPQHRFIRGNHDNPATCQTAPGWIADGTVEGDIMYLGGAWSIDNPCAPPGWYRRTPQYDWWPDEECSDAQFEMLLDIYKNAKPRIFITHDCPATISYAMFWKTGTLRGPVYPNRTSHWLDRFFETHQPDVWLFGHWHYTRSLSYSGTQFSCIGELDYVDI
jgi:predicted phosphodiesterase